MKTKVLIATLLTAAAGIGSAEAKTRYAGGDISLLPEYDKAKYYDPSGKLIPDFLTYSVEQGMNAMRVRLFVDPSKYTASDKDPNACQTLEYIIPICQRIKDSGSKLMLDFHYSDTWADPVKQWTPADWVSLSDEELYVKIYDYTKEVLQQLAAEGIVPDMIQTGNEISYGMLWGPYNTKTPKKCQSGSSDNWERFGKLLSQAIKACREECPNAKIILHTERTASNRQGMMTNFYNQMAAMNIDYDIIGLSYYPYFHGPLSTLKSAIETCTENYPTKEIMVVETGYPYAWAFDDAEFDVSDTYEYSEEGQNKFIGDVVNLLQQYDSCTGLFWWWPEYNSYDLSLSKWYNSAAVDSRTGYIQKGWNTLASYASKELDPDEPEEDDPKVDVEYPEFYLVYNSGGGWTYPGKQFTNNLDGTYTLENVYIASADDTDGWFTLATSAANWSEVEANRYGPTANNDKVTLGEPSKVEKDNQTSWQIAAGYYDLLFNYEDMILTVTEYVEPEPVQDFYLLYNNRNDGWSYPGTKFEYLGESTYILRNISISGTTDGTDAGWFVITTSGASSWDGVDTDGTFYGAENKAVTLGTEMTVKEGISDSWEVSGGFYTLVFNSEDLTLLVKEYSIYDDDFTVGVEEVEMPEGETLYFNLQGVRVTNPTKGIYVKVSGGRATKVKV